MGKTVASTKRERNPSKPLSERDFFAAQIQDALRITRTGHLLTIEQLPQPWRINPFVVRGYSFAASKTECLYTIFRLTNESFNIWSHILGVLFVLYLAFYDFPSTHMHSVANSIDLLVMAIYFVAAVLCLGCSVFWRTMKCHCDPQFMIACASVDLMGVTIMISAMNIVVQYSAFTCNSSLRRVYLLLTAFCCVTSLRLGWSSKFRHPNLAYVRVIVFTLLGVIGLLPMLHIWVNDGWEKAWNPYQSVWTMVVTPIFSGAWIYAGKIPERSNPEVFDYLGHSHNLWHVAVIVTVRGGYKTAVELLERSTRECRV